MAAEVYEVAFSGKIADSADLDKVKANVAQMFKADEAKLAHLFSGKRVVIKKDIDQQTALKYQAALTKAGAICEVVNLSENKQTSVEPVESSQVEKAPVESKVTRSVSSADIPAAPKTVPLDISGDQISDLPASLAPVGSLMQDEKEDVPEMQVDLTGMDMAPPG
ncbi:MAG: hypothetical protein OQK47_00235, partial [Gammaproteobacteria bacterium]|nr:hypothetical protein [Gammaproteobacteria bacterium]